MARRRTTDRGPARRQDGLARGAGGDAARRRADATRRVRDRRGRLGRRPRGAASGARSRRAGRASTGSRRRERLERTDPPVEGPAAGRGAVYGSRTVHTGDPVYLRLADEVHLTFRYTLETSAPGPHVRDRRSGCHDRRRQRLEPNADALPGELVRRERGQRERDARPERAHRPDRSTRAGDRHRARPLHRDDPASHRGARQRRGTSGERDVRAPALLPARPDGAPARADRSPRARRGGERPADSGPRRVADDLDRGRGRSRCSASTCGSRRCAPGRSRSSSARSSGC